ncbi:MAG: hypothetical protein OXF56_18860 [Rhodobacteraceae bacterium]|nr:hypothetical protein [Paracoccaceae bacterium]
MPQELPAEQICRAGTPVTAWEIMHRQTRIRKTVWDHGVARIMGAPGEGADPTRGFCFRHCAQPERKSSPAAALAYNTLARSWLTMAGCVLLGIRKGGLLDFDGSRS